MMSLKKMGSATLFCILAGIALFCSPAQLLGSDIQPTPVATPPGCVQGTGTYFEVTDSESLNITLSSTEEVKACIESSAAVVTILTEGVNGAASTDITLGGFPASTTYYKYVDSNSDYIQFTTDASGCHSYTQDLSQPHRVMIKSQPSTIFLTDSGWDPSGVGTWDPVSRIATLTGDVYDAIYLINLDNLVLDGGNHTIHLDDQIDGPGIYIGGSQNTTVKNLHISGHSQGYYFWEATGITVWSCSGILIDNISTSDWDLGLPYTDRAVKIEYSTDCSVVNSTISRWVALQSYESSFITVENNTMNCIFSIDFEGTQDGVIRGNEIHSQAIGIQLHQSSGIMVEDNLIADDSYYGGGIGLWYSDDNTVQGNVCSGGYDTLNGIYIYDSHGNVFKNNTIKEFGQLGLYFNSSNNNTAYNNSFIDNGLGYFGGYGGQAYQWSCVGNKFNLDAPVGGNYWSDWTGPDSNGDGFVDAPYVFIFQTGQDNLPWASEGGWEGPPPNEMPVADANGPYIAPATGWSGASVILDGSASYDPDGDAISYAWDLDLNHDSDGDGVPDNDADATTDYVSWTFPIGQTEVSLTVVDEQGLAGETVLTTVTVSIIDVPVDIKPGSYPNSINLESHGVIPIAFLTTEEFDAALIDPLTVTLRGEDFSDGLVKLRGKKGEVPMATLEDVDGDGDLDLLVKLDTERLAEFEVDTICELGALTFDGFVLGGSDTVHVVPVQ